MQSASPEPSRGRASAHDPGTATEECVDPPRGPQQTQDRDVGAPDTRAPAPSAGEHQVAVHDEQSEPVDVHRLRRLAGHVLVALDVPRELELSITCVDLGQMQYLNREHLHADRPTDVLAFPIDAPADVIAGVPGLLGDVIVCPRVAAEQSAAHGRTPQGEIDLLVVHGILHLLGHDHAEPDERDVMFTLTDRLLAAFDAAGASP